MPQHTNPREFLTRLLQAAIDAAQPSHCIGAYLPRPPRGRTIVVGAGKASAAMARAFETRWDAPVEGMVITRYGDAVDCERIQVVEAAHPVPDAPGARAAQRLLELVRGLAADDLVVCLLSGGGSSLLSVPGPGLTLEDLQEVNRRLLKSGATIAEVNCVRRHLSGVAGGRMAAACAPARVVNLVISDVPGDRPCDIASGPTVPDPTTCADALAIARRYGITLPPAARRLLESGRGETVKPDDPRMARIETRLIATPRLALEAAAILSRADGIAPLVLGDRIEGESREVGKVLAGVALSIQAHGEPLPPPCVLLSGGETTVTVRGHGRGGPNVECLLSIAITLAGAADIHALAADTDGVDGTEPIAGALMAPDTLARARAAGMAPRMYLDDNDAHTFFSRLDDSIVTGPTHTNVNDFRAILVL